MKNLYPIFVVGMILVSFAVKAQTTDSWQPVLVNPVNGTNSFNGVEAYYSFTACSNTEVVLLELINHNNYTVRAAWKNFIINNDGQKMPSTVAQDSVTIQPGGKLIGDCKGSSPSMVYKLTDFGTDKLNAKEYAPGNFDFVIVH
jgi:hypothetical protein